MKRVLAIVLASFSFSAYAGNCTVQITSDEFAFNLNAISAMEAGPIEGSKAHGLILKFDNVGKILLEFPSKEDLTAGLTLMGRTAVENECLPYMKRFLVKPKDQSVKEEPAKRKGPRMQV